MSLNSPLTLALAALSLTAIVTADDARGRHFPVFDADSGRKILDDERLDGWACAVGSRAVFNPFAGTFSRVPAVKCSF